MSVLPAFVRQYFYYMILYGQEIKILTCQNGFLGSDSQSEAVGFLEQFAECQPLITREPEGIVLKVIY